MIKRHFANPAFGPGEELRHTKIRLKRADNKCELCGNEAHRPELKTGVRIKLKVIHINHNENDFGDGNLLCVCQVCIKEVKNYEPETLAFVAQMKNEYAF